MPEPQIILTGIQFGESPRWHDGRVWFCDWAAEELVAVDDDGNRELIANVPSFPFCIAWTPDGQLLITSARDKAVLTLTSDKKLETFADLTAVSDRPPNNEIVVDGHGHVYVNGGGFDLMAGEPFAPGIIALVEPDGGVREVADDIHFGNGMAVTPDNETLIVAESYASRLTAFDIEPDGTLTNRRVWASLENNDAPDGICVDAESAVWYASVPGRHCVRVREGGDILQEIELDRGCFSCALGGPDRTTLYIVAREWHGADIARGAGTGQLVSVPVTVPGAGWP
jgi:sugar lactone lactonase YvrE